MAEKSPKLKKEIDVQGQEAKRVLNKMNSNRPIVRHIIKMSVLEGNYSNSGLHQEARKISKRNQNLPPKRMFKLPYSCIHVTY